MSLSLPEPLLSSLENTAGFDRAAFIQVHAESISPSSVRYNDVKLKRYKGDLPGDAIPWSHYGYYLDRRPSFTHDPLFHAGLYYVQEPGSQFLWEALAQTTDREMPVRVLDLCGAPGGKSTLLASYFKNGLIVTNEVIKNRAAVLTENIIKWGTGNVVVTNNDPKHFQRLQGYFDIIVVDAPCSGSGLFRKDNQAIREWSESNVALCSKRQQRILSDVLPALKEGGLLIYSTCSYSTEEDEEVIGWLEQSFPLETVPLKVEDGWGITVVTGIKPASASGPTTKSTGYKFFPDKAKSEGFFLSVFRKTGRELPVFSSGSDLPVVSSREAEVLAPWIKNGLDYLFFKQQADILGMEKKWAQDLEILQKNLFLKKAGIKIGEIKNKGLVPAHDLGVSTIVSDQVQRCVLDRAQSLQYLKRQGPDIEGLGGKNGWALAEFEKIGLGWMKILPGRVNNYYPQAWRILKD